MEFIFVSVLMPWFEMKEMKFNSGQRINEIDSILSQLFDYFQSTGLRREEYFVSLFLLCLYNSGIDFTVMVGHENPSSGNDYSGRDTDGRLLFRVGLKDVSNLNYPLVSNDTQKLNDAFKPTLEKLGVHGLSIASKILESIDRDLLKNEFPEIFDGLLYRLSKSQGRFAGEYILPQELSRFMCNLAELPKNSKVYNPFSGLASFGVFLESGQDYIGQEINQLTWAIGVLRLIAYDRVGKTSYLLSDSIHDWNPTWIRKPAKSGSDPFGPSEKEKFDLIISEPPFGIKIPMHVSGVRGVIKTYEHFLIESSLADLKPNGKIIVCIPQGVLFRPGPEKNLRQYLIEKDFLEMVISFPGGLLMNTGVSVAVLVICKNKKEKGNVKFVDATNFVESTSSKEKRLNDYRLNSVIFKSEESDVLKIISNEKIEALDYNLNLPRYFQKEFRGTRLGDLGIIIRGRRVHLDRRVHLGLKGKFVRIRDLKDDKVDFQLLPDTLPDAEPPSHAKLIDESCVLMAMRWRTLKPTYFKYDGTPIYVSNDLIAFKVKESIVDAAYLVNELQADYVAEQLQAYRTGEPIPMIKREDLLSVKVRIPSVEEQRAKVAGIVEISAKINQLQTERNALAHGLGRRQFNEFASLKHTLGTPRQNILSYAEALIRFFENNPSAESQKVSAAFRESMGVDINSAFHAIKHDINFISELLEKGENGLVLSDYPLEIIDLPEIEKIVTKTKSDAYNFSLKMHPVKSYNKAQQGIECNATLIKVLLDNILTNAHKHGFESKLQGNEVSIELSVIDDNLVVDIKNNGRKFPKGFNKEKFISKYSTANPKNGTGLGGYDINRIIEYFSGTWDLILNEDAIYPVRFRIQFPLKLIT